MKKSLLALIMGLLALLVGFSSCSQEPIEKEGSITVILGKNGKGNNDYTALIYKAIEKWEKDARVNVTVYEPASKEEALELYRKWGKESIHEKKALMIPANGEYGYMVATEDLHLQPNQQVLSFEFKLDQPFTNVHAFEINHAGVSFLAGKLAALCPKALIIAGHRNSLLNTVISYFEEGYGKTGALTTVELSSQYDGFNMPDKAKTLAQENKDAFILPLAGLSNQGVFDALNECQAEDDMIACGMDIDCNDMSPRIPFSFIINIDKAVDRHIECWVNDQPWPNPNMGLEEGMTEIRMSPHFTTVAGISLADFQRVLQENWQEAIQKDKQ